MKLTARDLARTKNMRREIRAMKLSIIARNRRLTETEKVEFEELKYLTQVYAHQCVANLKNQILDMER